MSTRPTATDIGAESMACHPSPPPRSGGEETKTPDMVSSTSPPHSEKRLAYYDRGTKYDALKPRILALMAEGTPGTTITKELGISYSSLMKYLSKLRTAGDTELAAAAALGRINYTPPPKKEKKPRQKRERKPRITWDPYKLSTIRRELRKGATIKSVAKMIEVSEATLGNFLRESVDPTIRGALTKNKNIRTPQALTRPKYESLEERMFAEFGKTSSEVSDENVLWMRAHGYEQDMKTTVEREHRKMLKERREGRNTLWE